MADLFESILASAKAQTDSSLAKKSKKAEASFGSWKNVKGDTKSPYFSRPADTWTTRDLYHFFTDKFLETTGHEYGGGVAPMQQCLLLLQDAMAQYLGARPTQEQTRDYIEWFLVNKAVMLITKFQCFKPRFMYASYDIAYFFEQYRGQDRPAPPVDTSSFYSQKSMESVYLVNFDNFVLKYGLVLATCWVMMREGLSEAEAIERVKRSAKSLCNDDKHDALATATEKPSPYPMWCRFAGLKKMLVDLTSETGEFFDILDIRFSEKAPNLGFLNPKE